MTLHPDDTSKSPIYNLEEPLSLAIPGDDAAGVIAVVAMGVKGRKAARIQFGGGGEADNTHVDRHQLQQILHEHPEDRRPSVFEGIKGGRPSYCRPQEDGAGDRHH